MILGDRIRLRAIERDDLPKYQKWLDDPELRAGISMYKPFSMEDEPDWSESMRKRPKDEQPLGIEVREKLDVYLMSMLKFEWPQREQT